MWVDTTLHNYLNQPDRNHVLVEIIDVSAEMAAQEALQEQRSCCVASPTRCPTGSCRSTPSETSSTTTPACSRSCMARPDAGSGGAASRQLPARASEPGAAAPSVSSC